MAGIFQFAIITTTATFLPDIDWKDRFIFQVAVYHHPGPGDARRDQVGSTRNDQTGGDTARPSVNNN